MGTHSRRTRPQRRVMAMVAIVGLATVGAVGTANAGPDLAAGTPCATTAEACVDLDAKLAWLIDDQVVRGPVPISSGGPGRETPRGAFTVEWKNKDHRSAEFDGAPMPFAVFFAEGGIAFHEGNLHTNSAGCVRMAYEDARAFFDFLQIGDDVEVH